MSGLRLPWNNLRAETKEAVRNTLPSAAWRALKRIGGAPLHRLHTFEELEAFLKEAELAFARSDVEGRQLVERVLFEPNAWPMPKDPASDEYRRAQLDLYARISGRSAYVVDHEFSQLDPVAAKANPFPFSSQSAELVGDQLLAQGFLLKTLNVAPGARLLEFGPGWGHTTELFLRLGWKVTAVEVDPGFCELLKTRLQAWSDLTLVRQDMLEFSCSERFDAIVFFESFHHCVDHLLMLKKVHSLLRTGGVVAFAAEPIADFAWPWGVRTDGLSLYSMRRYGWLELGFESGYFTKLLRQLGFTTIRQRAVTASPLCDVLVATKR